MSHGMPAIVIGAAYCAACANSDVVPPTRAKAIRKTRIWRTTLSITSYATSCTFCAQGEQTRQRRTLASFHRAKKVCRGSHHRKVKGVIHRRGGGPLRSPGPGFQSGPPNISSQPVVGGSRDGYQVARCRGCRGPQPTILASSSFNSARELWTRRAVEPRLSVDYPLFEQSQDDWVVVQGVPGLYCFVEQLNGCLRKVRPHVDVLGKCNSEPHIFAGVARREGSSGE